MLLKEVERAKQALRDGSQLRTLVVAAQALYNTYYIETSHTYGLYVLTMAF